MFDHIAPEPNKPPSNAALKTALAAATAVGLLAAYRHFVDHDKGISPSIFADAAHVDVFRHKPAPPVPVAPPKPPTTAVKGAHAPISAYFSDDSGSLDAFYEAVYELQTHPKPNDSVLVLHYGDSPTTADLITGDVRQSLQEKFGDAGSGFILPGKPWAWYQHRGVDVSDKGWNISTAVGKGREEVYGLGGARFEGGSGASSHITLKDPPSSVEISYLAQPGGGDVAVSANGTQLETFSTSGDSGPAWHSVALPFDVKTFDIKPSGAPVKLLGENFRTASPGIVYDSLGLNGASTSVLSNGFNEAAWAAELKHDKPALVIINYGTNESGFGSYVDKQYEPTLRKSIQRIRTALPGEPILVMSPMDRGKRSGVDQIETYDTIPRIVAIQRRVAAEMGCAFFDTFDAMGGDGTMARWYNGHPRLVAGDLIHPTPQGAGMVAQLLVKDLLTGYDVWRKSHGHEPIATSVPSAPAPVATPAGTAPPPPAIAPAKPSAGIPTPAPPPAQPSNGPQITVVPSNNPEATPAPQPAPKSQD